MIEIFIGFGVGVFVCFMLNILWACYRNTHGENNGNC